MNHLVNFKLFESIDVETMPEEEKIQFIEQNIEQVKAKDKDGIISDKIYSKVKNGLTKTLAVATIAALVMLTMQSCAGSRSCPNMTWGQARQKYLR
jgi:hypothetical protein